MPESASQNVTSSQGIPYNDANTIQIRLNPDQYLARIEMYLRGAMVNHYQDEQGKLKTEVVQRGQAKANEYGVDQILLYLSGLISPTIVQGNFPINKNGYSEAYDIFIFHLRSDIGDYLLMNEDDFEIDSKETLGIIRFIMNVITPFMTRLLGNKERESYYHSFKDTQSNTIKEGGGFSLFKGKGK